MNKCPITYQPCEGLYSKRGLTLLSPRLSHLDPFPYSAQEQRIEAASRAAKMSIQGVQAKLNAKLSVRTSTMQIVDNYGTYILKPQSDLFPEVPQNEDLTMKMARAFGIEVPLTGMIYSKDGSLTYFIKRFDRYGRNKKYHVEDFQQLTANKRSTKYKWSMEKLIPVLDKYCTFPLIEKRKLFRRVLFCFLTGNEDMHLKNWSLINQNGRIHLSPAYDLLNSTIAVPGSTEELALPLNGKKSNLTKSDLIDYYGKERLQLNDKIIESELTNIREKQSELIKLIEQSILTNKMIDEYKDVFKKRLGIINLES